MNIELIPWTEAEPDDIARIFSDVDRSYLADGLPTPYTRDHVEKWLSEEVLPKEGKRGLFRIIRVDGKCAGDVQLACKDGVYRRDADLGYVLLDEYKGQGVMTEAVGRICAEAFEKLDILRISARVYAPNLASRRVLEKNGFQLEGSMRQAVCKGEQVYNMLLYGKLCEE
ncbi:MAG: GNAT family N-acetyltransferase [Clostridia bacterium]|nr:GNAT family N-acetyltransferase [Clostridia bacterium]